MAQPPITPEAVAAIVAEVLRRVRAQAAASSARAPAAAAQSAAGVVLAERVLSLSILERLPPGTRQVILPPTAAVTPSARDHAREHGISIVRAGQSATLAPVVRPFVIAHADCPAVAVARCAAIARLVPTAQQLPPSGLADVLQAIATHTPDIWVTVELYPYRDRPDDAARAARAHLLGIAQAAGVEFA